MTNLMTPIQEMDLENLELVTGGTVNKNPNPGKLDNGIDQILNGQSYDALAEKIAKMLNPAESRTRKVNNDVDIYDCDI